MTTQPTTSALDKNIISSTLATTSPNLLQNTTAQTSADSSNYFLDNVTGDGDCLFRYN